MAARARPDGCLSDLVLDQMMVGEAMAPAARRAAEGHLAACAICRGRRADIAAEPALEPDPAAWAGRVAAPAASAGAGRWTWRRVALINVWVLRVAAVGAMLLAWVHRNDDIPTRIKGGELSMDVVVRRGDGRVEPLGAAPLHPGDALRFRVHASRPGYVAVVGLDGGGQASLYAPVSGQPAEVQVKDHPAAVDLPGSLVLDGVLGEEKVVAVLCASAGTAARAVEAGRTALAQAGAAARVSRLDLPCLQAQASYRKAAPP
jgi:hypothetical protein